jgi:hypothetical protein
MLKLWGEAVRGGWGGGGKSGEGNNGPDSLESKFTMSKLGHNKTWVCQKFPTKI